MNVLCQVHDIGTFDKLTNLGLIMLQVVDLGVVVGVVEVEVEEEAEEDLAVVVEEQEVEGGVVEDSRAPEAVDEGEEVG